MCVYIVRLKDDGQAKAELVGIYVAHGVAELEQLIERCCSKFVCEYAEVQHGCMYGPQVGSERLYEESNAPRFVAADELSEDWHELFFGTASVEWHSFCDAPWRSDGERRDAFASARHALEIA